jgi:hypothetical protein
MAGSESVLVSFVFGGGLLVAALLVFRRRVSLGDASRLADRNSPVTAGARRRQACIVGLLIALGVLIPLGDLWLTWHRDPRWFAVYVLVVLLASLWLLVLGVCEALSVLTAASHGKRAGSRRDPGG